MSPLPDYIFFVGAPGSRWSGVAQDIETDCRFNISDRELFPSYCHHAYTGHVGAYFGTGWQAPLTLSEDNFNQQFASPGKTKLLKSHEWAYYLNEIYKKFINQWIILVYRPDLACYAWWHEAGGFSIKYPDYRPFYKNSHNILAEIAAMNAAILSFGHKHNAQWLHYSASALQKLGINSLQSSVDTSDLLITRVLCSSATNKSF